MSRDKRAGSRPVTGAVGRRIVWDLQIRYDTLYIYVPLRYAYVITIATSGKARYPSPMHFVDFRGVLLFDT